MTTHHPSCNEHCQGDDHYLKLAEGPMRVLAALTDSDRSFFNLRDYYGATSDDMNVLTGLGLIRAAQRSVFGLAWTITDEGRAALRLAESREQRA